jgi:hypothetical protein
MKTSPGRKESRGKIHEKAIRCDAGKRCGLRKRGKEDRKGRVTNNSL